MKHRKNQIRTATRILIFATTLAFTAAVGAEQSNGEKIWDDGTRYIGGLANGKRHGDGKIIWPDGTQFIGTFVENQREGLGKLVLPDDSTYVAMFNNDMVVDGSVKQEMPELVLEAGVVRMNESGPMAPDSERYLLEMGMQLESTLRNQVENWSESWSEQNLTNYFSHYSQDFVPADNLTVRTWKQVRSSRVNRPRSISVMVDNFEFDVSSAKSASVIFEQRYRSNLYRDVTTKRLDYKLEEDGWKIVREIALN